MVFSALGRSLVSISKKPIDFLIGTPGLDFGNNHATCALCVDEGAGFHG